MSKTSKSSSAEHPVGFSTRRSASVAAAQDADRLEARFDELMERARALTHPSFEAELTFTFQGAMGSLSVRREWRLDAAGGKRVSGDSPWHLLEQLVELIERDHRPVPVPLPTPGDDDGRTDAQVQRSPDGKERTVRRVKVRGAWVNAE